MKKYPHLEDVTEYPNDDVAVFESNEVTFDYSRWNGTAKAKLCYVLWDGSATAPNFATEAARRSYFDSKEGFEFDVADMMKPNRIYDVPLPYDQAATCNYLVLSVPMMTSEASPIDYEGDRYREWFFFVDSFEAIAPNTTRLTIREDTWTQYAPTMKLANVVLERGHYPVAHSNVNAYLADPIGNNEFLLAPDVAANAPSVNAHSEALVFNDTNVYCLVCCSGNFKADWGTAAANTWNTPSSPNSAVQGVPSGYAFAMKASSTLAFFANVQTNLPNFLMTIQAIFFVSSKLLKLGTKRTFGGATVWEVDSQPTEFDVIKIDKDMFGYPEEFADLAKLYTSPYASIKLTDGEGQAVTVKIEDTDGEVKLSAVLSIAAPMIHIRGILKGIGGRSENLTFTNLTGRKFAFGGTWYDSVLDWGVPTYAVNLNAYQAEWARNHYWRETNKTSWNNSYSSATASASTAQTNAYNSANVAVTNTAVQIGANNTINSRSITASYQDYGAQNSLNQALQAYNAGYSRSMTAIEIEGEQASAGVAIGGTVANTIGSIVSNPAGALGSIFNGIVSGATTAANTAIAINTASSKTEAAISNSQSTVNETNQNNADRTNVQNSANTDNLATQNSASSSIAANSASTAKTNAANSYSTAIANAGRARSTSQAANSNGWKNAGMAAPIPCGASNIGNGNVQPLALFANVERLSDSELKRIGCEFLRYGYRLNRYIDFDGFGVMKEFSYWKMSEADITFDYGATIGARDGIMNILSNGVTVWEDPDHIGRVSIYGNN